ncbi:MAG: hypothetical protein WCL50_12340, partial [Spirochaetota bacterium]
MPSHGERIIKLMQGNEACTIGALAAGLEFYAGYPITPSTEIMRYLEREIWKYGGTVLQAEDEIAGIGAVVGASFAGKKAMTATSGPGMSLKTEILGLASLAELPLMLVLALGPLDDATHDHPLSTLLTLPQCTAITLSPLSSAEILTLASAHLEGATLSPALAAIFERQSSGNPFVVEELAFFTDFVGFSRL